MKINNARLPKESCLPLSLKCVICFIVIVVQVAESSGGGQIY